MRSGEQPQVLQSPVHSPVTACATVADFSARGAKGLIAVTMYIAAIIPAIMWREKFFKLFLTVGQAPVRAPLSQNLTQLIDSDT
jgi:hypothetical protein